MPHHLACWSFAISIHTPLAGSDNHTCALPLTASCNFNPHSPCGERPYRSARSSSRTNFNPHSPCGERPDRLRTGSCCGSRFQSTLPLRGATGVNPCLPVSRYNFNPHSPCGERLGNPTLPTTVAIISIHTPLAGSDRPVWRVAGGPFAISIHTPLAGSD